MTEAELKRALNEIVRLYLRSNKRDRNTCYQMFLVAKKTLEEIEPADPLPDEADAASIKARWG